MASVDTYRLGNHRPENIYRVNDEHPEGVYIGHACNKEDADLIVRALNMMAKEWQYWGEDGRRSIYGEWTGSAEHSST